MKFFDILAAVQTRVLVQFQTKSIDPELGCAPSIP